MNSIFKLFSCTSSKNNISEDVLFSYGHSKCVNIQNKVPTNKPILPVIVEEDDIWLRKTCGHEIDLNTGKKSCGCYVLKHEENFIVNQRSSEVGNQLMLAFLQAYNNHEDVVLSPDDVWLTILLEFSAYVNKHAEKLRTQFVSHEGQEHLKVDSNFELDETQWDEFFELMLLEISNNTKEGVTDLLQSSFTTTGRVERLLSAATVMDTFKQYFTYERYICSCGIHNVYFMGVREDWVKLIDKLEVLRRYDVDGKLSDYVYELSQVLNKWLDTFDGKVDVSWWNTVMDYRNESIGSGSDTAYMITGWILKFSLPYCKHMTVDSEMLFGKYINVPVKLTNADTGVTKMVNVVGGFGGLNVQNRAYRPQMSLSVLVLDQQSVEKSC